MKAASGSKWKVVWALVVAGLVVAALIAGYLLRPEVLVVAAKRDTVPLAVPGTVTVFAEYEMELKNEVGGRIISSVLALGQKFKSGDVLVKLDSGDIDIEIERINSEIAAAKKKVELGSTLSAEVLNAHDTLDNLERQVKAGAASGSELEKQRRLYQQLQTRMELEEVANKLALDNFVNSLHAKQREKAKMTISSPIDGVIIDVLARKGDLIGANSPIATIMTTTRKVEAKLSEENFTKVRLGQKASVRFLSYGTDQYDAVVTQILPSADATTQRYTAFLDVKMPEGKELVPGLTGEVSIIITQHANAIVVPRRALVGDYVYVADGEKLDLRKVDKGIEGLKEVEITSGLKEGDLVVVEQQDRFHDGEHVRPKILVKD